MKYFIKKTINSIDSRVNSRVKLNFKYRIYPTKAQATKIDAVLEACRFIYNTFLEERKTAYEKTKKSVGVYDQINRLPLLKKTYPSLKNAYSQVLQNVAVRLDLAFQAFFRRLKTGQTPGYPRFKGEKRYSSFTYPQAKSWSVLKTEKGEKIDLPKIGQVPLVLHRPLEGIPKTVSIVKSPTGKYYAVVSCNEVERKAFLKNNKEVGLDVGILTFATLSDGETIENPRFFETDQKALSKTQRKAQKARDKILPRSSVNGEKAVVVPELSSEKKQKVDKAYKVVRRVHERIKHRRDNFNHQTSLFLVKSYGKLFVEDIDANAMLKKRWCNKQILDAAWSDFLSKLTYKAAYAGRTVLRINPAYTSQTCSKCGTRVLHELKDRVFTCGCGYTENRDLNAAKNILALGLQCLAKA